MFHKALSWEEIRAIANVFQAENVLRNVDVHLLSVSPQLLEYFADQFRNIEKLYIITHMFLPDVTMEEEYVERPPSSSRPQGRSPNLPTIAQPVKVCISLEVPENHSPQFSSFDSHRCFLEKFPLASHSTGTPISR
jgi:hypothetical protein